MAYGVRYRGGWHNSTLQGYVYIDQKDYTGAIEEILIVRDSLVVSEMIDSLDDHIVKRTCGFTILNNKADFYSYMPLMTATDQFFRIRVVILAPVAYAQTFFEGFSNVEACTQKMLRYQNLNIVASGYLNKTSYLSPSVLSTIQDISLIDLIDSILTTTGASYNIRVNSSLVESSEPVFYGYTIFNYGVNTELFWEDNVTKKKGLEILEMILESFDAYLYWKAGYWYIEQKEDIWTASGNFVEYTTGTSYGFADSGSVVSFIRNTTDIHSLVFRAPTQTIRTTPGAKEVELTLNLGRGLLRNFVPSDLTGALDTTASPQNPDLRTWNKWNDGDGPMLWLRAGKSTDGIANGIIRGFSDFVYIENYFHLGLSSKFKITVGEETVITLKWKYKLPADYVPDGLMENLSCVFHWYLRHGTEYFVRDSEGVFSESATTEANGINEESKAGTSFDPDTLVCEVTVSVPIGEATSLLGDKELVFCIGTEVFYNVNNPSIPLTVEIAWFGDILVTVSNDAEDDVVTGEITTDFLNKKEYSLDLIDISNLNYRNGVLRALDYVLRTETWDLGVGGGEEYTLVERIMVNKFRQYQKTRQRIYGDLKSSIIYDLFSLWTDSKQSDLQFVLTGVRHNLTEDKVYVQFDEFDVWSEVTLNTI